MPKSKNIIDAFRAELAADPTLAGLVEQESLHVEIAEEVFSLRKAAGLSQKQLAEMIGTSQSVISRIEDADYDGHSLSLLRRIASALGKKLLVKFCSEEQKTRLQAIATSSEAKFSLSPVFPRTNVSIVYCTSTTQPSGKVSVAGHVGMYVARNLQPALAE